MATLSFWNIVLSFLPKTEQSRNVRYYLKKNLTSKNVLMLRPKQPKMFTENFANMKRNMANLSFWSVFQMLKFLIPIQFNLLQHSDNNLEYKKISNPKILTEHSYNPLAKILR